MLRKIRSLRRQVRRYGRQVRRSLGYFEHRRVKVFHPGALVNQPEVAEAIDGAIQIAVRRGVPAPVIVPLLGRVILVLGSRPFKIGAGRVGHDARWTGGAFDLGIAKVHLDDRWADRIRQTIAALLISEGRPVLREQPEDEEDAA